MKYTPPIDYYIIGRFIEPTHEERIGELPQTGVNASGKLHNVLLLSPSIHKFDHERIYSGLSAALGHEHFDLELSAERLGPNGVSNILEINR